MRLIGFIVAVAIAMAALKLAAAVVALLIVGGLLWSAITYPKETLCWIAGFTALELVSRFPVVSILLFGALVVAAKLVK